jgi:hypothetical protein
MGRMSALVLGVLVFALTAARAETPEERQACTDDAFQVCGDAIPDRNRVFTCLVQNKDRISALCRTALAPYLPPEPRQASKKATASAKDKKGKAKRGASARRGPVDLSPDAR